MACIFFAFAVVAAGDLIIATQTARAGGELDQSDAKAAFVTNALITHLARHDQSLIVAEGKKVQLGNYVHAPSRPDVKRLKKTLRITAGEYTVIKRVRACAQIDSVCFTPAGQPLKKLSLSPIRSHVQHFFKN